MNQSPLPLAEDDRTVLAKARIGFIQAGWHSDILDKGHQSFVATLSEAGLPEDNIERHFVPGGYEIPLLAKRLIETRSYDAIVATALIVDGGIYRHDFVARAVIDGMMRVQLDTGTPVLSVVLTPHHFHEHSDHLDFFAGHFVKKGQEAARAVIQTVLTMDMLSR
ncbi:6,7-dimethyl-8-ribityllumazine synthase [Coralliovum pocilloporae]|uniref:6,7-dimethyl-8-ribityllumazine synthase n=1 Tax=Coralliovum pocilloporae TaxID=3066369 RepID=UPI0033078D1D